MRFIVVGSMVGLALYATGCAKGTSGAQCVPTEETCVCDAATPCPGGYHCESSRCVADKTGGDGGPAVDGGSGADQGADAAAPGGFGEACTDKSQCKSKICISSGTSGVCSRRCTAGNCPKGYGCLGVRDQIEPGKVIDVCVPTTTQLCTVCAKDSECGIGKNLCLSEGTAKFCGRDCTKVGCPNGYTCKDVTVGTTKYKQCVPTSGSCSCDASKKGTTRTCTITTTTGTTCNGTRTCQGASGWSKCQPPNKTDTPDASFKDDNCDGIDGDIKAGIFVATNGTDSSTCGTSTKTACRTITRGISRAQSAGFHYVYIQAGSYDEVVALESGIHLYGGYDSSWKRDARTKSGHEVKVTGKLDSSLDQYVTVRAHKLTVATTVADMVLVGADAGGANSYGTRSSQVVHASLALGLTLERVTIQAGDGASGASGSGGQDASTVTATSSMRGGSGGAGKETFQTCNNTSKGSGGRAGSNSCSGASPTAGSGGSGGTMDSSCTCVLGVCACAGSACTARSGSAGTNASQWSTNSYGYRGSGGAGGSTCGNGNDGRDGRVRNGGGGTGGRGGRWNNGFWYANSGSTGSTGSTGGGGGGGGGSGGCDRGTDAWGAGGGGGGAGGCAARSGGRGGRGGGGSFGVLADTSTVILKSCVIQRGNGGDGGSGGAGGQGQSGGSGGSGGSGAAGTGSGGDGGHGGHGGHSGGGGGGAGGISYGIYSLNSSITQSCSFSGGSAGSGGRGGAQASAPVGERDGNAGKDGVDAPAVGDEGTCSSAGSC